MKRTGCSIWALFATSVRSKSTSGSAICCLAQRCRPASPSLARSYDAVRVEVTPETVTVERIAQTVMFVEADSDACSVS